jgi:hypothetical protein
VRKRSFLALFALVVLAGCGGGGGNQTTAVEQAVKTSPLTYYHYAGATWWGRPVRVQLMVTRIDKGQATAVVNVYSSGKVAASQTLLLQKNGGQWSVSGSEETGTAAETDFGNVSGPEATRPPTSAEAAAIRAGALKSFSGEGDCLQFIDSVSKVDPTWASAVIKFVGPNRIRCATTGTPVMHKGAAGWKMVAVENGVMACTAAPAGVIRSLFGTCRIVGSKG